MQEQEKGMKGWISRFAKKLDDTLRYGDFRSNRTAGGLLDKKLGIRRHSWHYLVLPALVAASVVMGVPEISLRLLFSGLTFVGVLLVLVWLSKKSETLKWSVHADLVLQVIVVLAVCAIVFVAGGPEYRAGVWIYRNFFIPAAVIVGATLILARVLCPWIWKNIRRTDTYDQALKKTELFVSRGKSVIDSGFGGLLRAFLTVVPGAPLQLLLIPSFIALLARRHLLWHFTLGALAVCYLILFIGGLDPRLNYIWRMLQQAFFRGAALIVSLVIILLAALRLLDISYVSTVFDTAEGLIIALILLSVYVLLWWYDYWVNRLLAQELLSLLDEENARDGKISYAIDPESVKTHVSRHDRDLQVHGSSRFIVIGNSPKYPHPVFHTHEFIDMFTLMATSAFPGGKVKLSPAHISERILDFKYLTVLILLGLSAATGLFINAGPQQPQLKVDSQAAPRVHLAQLLDQHASRRTGRPALLVAASGGGTRAALYTASVLEGLAHRGRIEDVIMGSGVSGGGAALAYFAGQREGLVKSGEKRWDKFFEVMRQPFIQDVINGALQWRIVYDTRLGVLLSESFENRWQLDPICRMGQVEDFGLILNTAIAGRFDCTEAPLATAARKLRKKDTHTEMAGGRLILTNLALGKGFVSSVEKIGGPKDLPVVVHDPEVRLEVAAALNANFPPIFSNAAIDIDSKTRYWVTDGGAVDNRGIEMLLYCLRDSLASYAQDPTKPLPAVTVVVLDASGFSNRYSQDRGLGTMMNAGRQYASLLVAEQLADIEKLYAIKKQPDDFKFINLPMPLCLRESGSFGTHWMLQPNIKIDLGSDRSERVKGLEMVTLLRALHTSGMESRLSPEACSVLYHARSHQAWQEGAKSVGLID